MPAIAVVLALLLLAGPAAAETLTVAVPQRPPFAEKGGDDSWRGIGVDLWRLVAEDLGLSYRIVGLDETLIEEAVASGSVDVALAIDATPDVMARMNVTMPYFTATLAIAEERDYAVVRVARNLATWQFLQVILSLTGLLLVVGAIVWLVERRHNPGQFSRHPLKGLGDGFWWAGVTLTTIGYGDKTPTSPAGRAVAMIWMLVGLAVSAALTAAVINATNVDRGATLTLPRDIAGKRIAVIPGSSADVYLAGLGVNRVEVNDVPAAIAAVKHHKADAIAGSSPELRDALRNAGSDLVVSSTRQGPQYVTFGVSLAVDPDLARRIGVDLLDRITSEDWTILIDRYLPDHR